MDIKVVNYANKNCHIYGTAVLNRVIKFAEEHDLDSDPEVLWHTVTNEMVTQNPNMLILAGVENGKVAGHMLTRIVNNDGTLVALITQIEIDDDAREDRAEMWTTGWPIVENFARSRNAKRIRCWAMNEKLATLFKRFGFKPKSYVLMDIGLEANDG